MDFLPVRLPLLLLCPSRMTSELKEKPVKLTRNPEARPRAGPPILPMEEAHRWLLHRPISLRRLPEPETVPGAKADEATQGIGQRGLAGGF